MFQHQFLKMFPITFSFFSSCRHPKQTFLINYEKIIINNEFAACKLLLLSLVICLESMPQTFSSVTCPKETQCHKQRICQVRHHKYVKSHTRISFVTLWSEPSDTDTVHLCADFACNLKACNLVLILQKFPVFNILYPLLCNHDTWVRVTSDDLRCSYFFSQNRRQEKYIILTLWGLSRNGVIIDLRGLTY